MIAFTATVMPLREIHAEFREDCIKYPDMILSGRVLGGYGSLNLLPKIESTLSPYSILEQGDAVTNWQTVLHRLFVFLTRSPVLIR